MQVRFILSIGRRYYGFAEHSCALGVAACDLTEAFHPLLVAMSAAFLILAALAMADASLERWEAHRRR